VSDASMPPCTSRSSISISSIQAGQPSSGATGGTSRS
jgi:hypothetical protein